MTKKQIQVEVDTIDLNCCTGKDIIEAVQELESTYERYGGVFFVESRRNYSYSEDGYTHIAVMIKREETDQEYNTRITSENAVKERQLAYKRKQLEQLKSELGE